MAKRGTMARDNNQGEAEIVEQAGALCLRFAGDGNAEILLVGSRRNGRWGLPKGHIDPGEATHQAAEREAYEEAGVKGVVSDRIIGSFVYAKDSSTNRYRVIFHALTITSIVDAYPEEGLRAREWFTLPEASSVAGHEGLRDLLRKLPAQIVRDV